MAEKAGDVKKDEKTLPDDQSEWEVMSNVREDHRSGSGSGEALSTTGSMEVDQIPAVLLQVVKPQILRLKGEEIQGHYMPL